MSLIKLTAILLLFPASAVAGDKPARHPRVAPPQTRFYDSGGRFLGKSIRSNGGIRFYGNGGRYHGRSEISGSTAKFYDAGGKYLGRSR